MWFSVYRKTYLGLTLNKECIGIRYSDKAVMVHITQLVRPSKPILKHFYMHLSDITNVGLCHTCFTTF